MRSVLLAVLVTLLSAAAHAQQHYVDQKGRQWRRMTQTSLIVSATQARAACPNSACHGTLAGVDVTGYTWASPEDVLELMWEFEPVAPIEGVAQFFTASQFSQAVGITFMFNTTYSMSEGTIGMTSESDSAGNPLVASVTYGHAMVSIGGGFGLYYGSDAPAMGRSMFLYRTADSNPPPPPPPPVTCAFNGQTLSVGSSVIAFRSATVPYGSPCESESRVCGSDGQLSGSFTNGTCTVQAPPPQEPPCKRYRIKKGVRICDKR